MGLFKQSLAAGAVAISSLLGVTTSNAATYDLAFIMDSSGSLGNANWQSSINSLAAALGNNLTAGILDQDQYNITVISFSNTASVIASGFIDEVSDLAALQASITAAPFQASVTRFDLAFSTLLGATGALTAGAAGSLINMMTDGVPYPTSYDYLTPRNQLIAQGWDSLSFEAIGNSVNTGLLAGLGFDTSGVGGLDVISDPNNINDPLNNAFVLEVNDFGTAYDSAIDQKIAEIVSSASPVPVPAALPLLVTAFGALGFAGMRRRKKT